jgi:hypothetical protein
MGIEKFGFNDSRVISVATFWFEWRIASLTLHAEDSSPRNCGRSLVEELAESLSDYVDISDGGESLK